MLYYCVILHKRRRRPNVIELVCFYRSLCHYSYSSRQTGISIHRRQPMERTVIRHHLSTFALCLKAASEDVPVPLLMPAPIHLKFDVYTDLVLAIILFTVDHFKYLYDDDDDDEVLLTLLVGL